MNVRIRVASTLALTALMGVLSVCAFAQSSADELMKMTMATGSSRIVDRVPGRNSSGPYALSYKPITEKTEMVTLSGQRLLRDIDYKIDCSTGMLAFMRPISTNENATVSYDMAPGAAKNDGTISVPVEQLITQGRSGKLNLVGNFTSKGGANAIGYGALGVATELNGANGFNFKGTVLSAGSDSNKTGDTTAMKLSSGFKVGFAEVSGELLQTGSQFKSSSMFGVADGTDVRKLAMKLTPTSAVSAVLGLTQDQSGGADKETRNFGLAFNPNQTVAMGFNRTEAQDGANTLTTDQTVLNLKGKSTSMAYTSTQGSNTSGLVTESTNALLGYKVKDTDLSFNNIVANDGKTNVDTNIMKLAQKFSLGALNYASTMTDKNGTRLENTVSSLNMHLFNSDLSLGQNYVDDGPNTTDVKTANFAHKLKNGQFDYATTMTDKNGVELENSRGQLAMNFKNTSMQLINTVVDDGAVRTDARTSIFGYTAKNSKLDILESIIDKNGLSLETRNVAYALNGKNTAYGLIHSINDDGAIRMMTNQANVTWSGKDQNAYLQQVMQDSDVLQAMTTLARYNVSNKFGSIGAEQLMVSREAWDTGISNSNNLKLTGVFDLGKHATASTFRESKVDDYQTRNDLDNNSVKTSLQLSTKPGEKVAVKTDLILDELNAKSMTTRSMQVQSDPSKSLGLKTTYTEKTGDLTAHEISQEVGFVLKPATGMQFEAATGTKQVGTANFLSQSASMSMQLSKNLNLSSSVQTVGANAVYTTTQLMKASMTPMPGVEFSGYQKMRKATGQDLPDTLNLTLKLAAGRALVFSGSYIHYPEDAAGKILLTETAEAKLSADLDSILLTGSYGLNKNVQTLVMSRSTGLGFEMRLPKDSVLNGGYNLLEAAGQYTNNQSTYKLVFKTPISKSTVMQLDAVMSKYNGTLPPNTPPEQQEIQFKISAKL